jgi:hypothetical protein
VNQQFQPLRLLLQQLRSPPQQSPSPPQQQDAISFSASSEVVVVTLLVLIRGRSGTYRGLTGLQTLDRSLSSEETRTAAEVKRSLLALASEALLDDSKYLEQAEVLCSRTAGGRALLQEEFFLLYPELWTL